MAEPVGDVAHVIITAMTAARQTLGADMPDERIMKSAVVHAHNLGLEFEFQRVVGDEGLAYEIRLKTGRGVVARRRRGDETWEDVFRELRLLPDGS